MNDDNKKIKNNKHKISNFVYQDNNCNNKKENEKKKKKNDNNIIELLNYDYNPQTLYSTIQKLPISKRNKKQLYDIIMYNEVYDVTTTVDHLINGVGAFSTDINERYYNTECPRIIKIEDCFKILHENNVKLMLSGIHINLNLIKKRKKYLITEQKNKLQRETREQIKRCKTRWNLKNQFRNTTVQLLRNENKTEDEICCMLDKIPNLQSKNKEKLHRTICDEKYGLIKTLTIRDLITGKNKIERLLFVISGCENMNVQLMLGNIELNKKNINKVRNRIKYEKKRGY